MAFFKLRWPGRQDSPQTGSKPDKPAKRGRAPQADSIEEMRRRARHRLMGASVLVLVGVVGFPLLFDSQPRPVPVDVAISIPDRDKVAPLAFPNETGAAAEKTDKTDRGDTPDTGLTDGEELVPAHTQKPADATPQRAAPAPAPTPTPAPQPVAERKPAEPDRKTEPAPQAKPAAQPAPQEGKHEPKRAVAADNGARARALLEGRTPAPAASTAPAGERFIVQVGAFSDDAKVQEVRNRLEKLGLKTYTQAINTQGGKRTTRVRLGPFDSRADAERAAERAKGAGLAAAVLTL